MMDTFAKKLAAGLVVAPTKLSWWPRHMKSLIRYATLEKGSAFEVDLRQIIGHECEEWESIIPVAARKGLMVSHAKLEMELAEAAQARKCAKLEKIGPLLIENSEEMAASFGASMVEFPEHQFLRMLGEHVLSYAELVRMKTADTRVNTGGRMEKSTLALAAFTTEWF